MATVAITQIGPSDFSNIRRSNFRLGQKASVPSRRGHVSAKQKMLAPAQLPSVKEKLPLRPKIEQGKRILRSRSFKAVQSQARDVKPARKIKSDIEKREGIKVRLGPGTLAKLLEVSVPLTKKVRKTVRVSRLNPVTLIDELVDEERLVDEPQKDSAGNVIMIKKQINIGDLSQSLETQIKELKDVIIAEQLKTTFGLLKLASVLTSISLSEKTEVGTEAIEAIGSGVIISEVGLSEDEKLPQDPLLAMTNLVDGRFITKEWWAVFENRNRFWAWLGKVVELDKTPAGSDFMFIPGIPEVRKNPEIIARGIGFDDVRFINQPGKRFVRSKGEGDSFQASINRNNVLDLGWKREGLPDRRMWFDISEARRMARIPAVGVPRVPPAELKIETPEAKVARVLATDKPLRIVLSEQNVGRLINFLARTDEKEEELSLAQQEIAEIKVDSNKDLSPFSRDQAKEIVAFNVALKAEIAARGVVVEPPSPPGIVPGTRLIPGTSISVPLFEDPEELI